MGLDQAHVAMHQDMGGNLIMALKGLRAMVSRKNVLVGRRRHGASCLSAYYATKGVHTSAKYLELGITGGVRRIMITIKGRVKKAKTSKYKVSRLNKENKDARALYTKGVYPQASYGMEGVGYSPWAIRTIRAMAADSMGCSKRGRCPITAIAVAKGLEWDPYVRGQVQLIKEWASIFPKIEPKDFG